jgi:hypothetical protein
LPAAGFLGEQDRAPRRAADRIASGRARDDGLSGPVGQRDADQAGLRGAFLVDRDQVRRMLVVRPERHLIQDGRRGTGRDHTRM